MQNQSETSLQLQLMLKCKVFFSVPKFFFSQGSAKILAKAFHIKRQAHDKRYLNFVAFMLLRQVPKSKLHPMKLYTHSISFKLFGCVMNTVVGVDSYHHPFKSQVMKLMILFALCASLERPAIVCSV